MTTLKTQPVKSMRRLVIAGALSTALFLGAALPALAANPSPTGTGQPSQSCQAFVAPSAPLNVNGFNTSGFAHAASVYAATSGTGSAHANNLHTVSQYDVACYQQSVH